MPDPAVVPDPAEVPDARPDVPRRRRRGTAVLIVCAVGWLLFTLAHLLLSGRVWWWVLPDLLPPPLYVLVPVLILAALGIACAVRRPPVRRATRAALLCTVGALIVGAPDSGLNPSALIGGDRQPTAGSIRVASWDTLFWNENEDPDRFYSYLTSLHADVYLLQEYMITGDDGPMPVDDTARLRAAFPGYTLVIRGELLTLSRLPVVGQRVLTAHPMTPPTPWSDYWDARVLRTDVRVGARTLSIYNVHIADPFDLGQSPLTTGFYSAVRDLGVYRAAQWRVLSADLAGNGHPTVVSGALNTQPGMGELRRLGSLRDAASASTSVYPVSFALRGAWLWRLDGTYVSANVDVLAYGLRGPGELSTHKAQLATLGVRG